MSAPALPPALPPAAALLLAAGMGTRMKSRFPKAALPLLGKPLARYPLDLCRRLGISPLVAVVGHGAEAVRAALGPGVECLVQDEQRGTGHAVQAAAPAFEGYEGAVLILQADNVLLTEETLRRLLERHAAAGAAATLLSAVLEDGGSYGRVVRGTDGGIRAIVEAKGAPPEVLAVREINAGAYVFQAPALFAALAEVEPDRHTGEIYLPEAVRRLLQRGSRVEVVAADDPVTALSVNDRAELAQAAAVLRRRVLHGHMLAGVMIEDPATTYIEPEVAIGMDTVIRPMTWLGGRTVVGEECDLGPSLRVTDCRLGDRVRAQFAVLTGSEVDDETVIGPFAQLRSGSRVGRKVKIGNFVELKNATVEDGASMGHLAYLGDAFVGEKSNIGAGTITCNYDGRRKHVTRIGRRCFIGSHTTLVAPVEVGDAAYTAAGSVITESVPPDSLAIARCRQTNKEEWAKRRRERESQE